jgi:Mrp family chromosome partitioning ATPase
MDATEQPIPGITPLLSLQKHYHLGLRVALLVLLVGVPFAWIKGQSYYTSESVFFVAPTYMKNLRSDPELEFQSNSQYRQYVNHLSVSVTRYDVVEKTLAKLKKSGIDMRPPSMTERKYIERLQKLVYVRAISDTYMVRVGMDSDEKEHLDELINVLTDTFIETTKNEQIYGAKERILSLQATAKQLTSEIEKLEAARIGLASQLGLTTFSENVLNPYDTLLAQTREKYTTVTLERIQIQANLEAFLKQREVPSSLARSLLEIRLQDNGLQAVRNEVVKRTEELRRIVAGLEERHPARQAASAELAQITQMLEAKESAFDKLAFDTEYRRLLGALQQRRQIEADSKALLDELVGQASNFATNFQRAMKLTSEIKKREKELQDIRERLSFLTVENNAIGFVHLVTPAMPPDTPMGIGRTKLLLAMLLASGLLGVLAPIGVDLLSTRIRTIKEAEKAMGIPAAGWCPARVDDPSRLFAQEQIRRFVSTLLRNRARADRQVFAFTAVGSAATATEVILNAAQIMQQLGLRVLVVDANCYESHPDFKLMRPGLTDYLCGKAPAQDLIHPYIYQDTELNVVGLGGHRAGGLQRLDLFKQIAQTWAATYDYVLYDLPPILLNADTEFLIEVLGQVFVVVEAEVALKNEVQQAQRMLQRLDPEAVGLFVNHIYLQRAGSDLRKRIVETLKTKEMLSFNLSSELSTLLKRLKNFRPHLKHKK